MILSLLVFICLPAMLVAIGLAFVPWRPLWLRAAHSARRPVASGYAIAVVPARWEFQAFFLGPGAVLALLGGLAAAFNARDARRARRTPGCATDPYPGACEHGP